MKRIGLILLSLAVAITAAGTLYWFGLWIPNEPSITAFPIRGIDVSHHQHAIDWPSVKRSGMKFAYIKATEGADYRDAEFRLIGLIRLRLEFHTAGIIFSPLALPETSKLLISFPWFP